jgi:hypothetical protein
MRHPQTKKRPLPRTGDGGSPSEIPHATFPTSFPVRGSARSFGDLACALRRGSRSRRGAANARGDPRGRARAKTRDGARARTQRRDGRSPSGGARSRGCDSSPGRPRRRHDTPRADPARGRKARPGRWCRRERARSKASRPRYQKLDVSAHPIFSSSFTVAITFGAWIGLVMYALAPRRRARSRSALPPSVVMTTIGVSL